jgi:hypothetical protein
MKLSKPRYPDQQLATTCIGTCGHTMRRLIQNVNRNGASPQRFFQRHAKRLSANVGQRVHLRDFHSPLIYRFAREELLEMTDGWLGECVSERIRNSVESLTPLEATLCIVLRFPHLTCSDNVYPQVGLVVGQGTNL